MVIGKEKFALWITPEAKREVETHYKQDNCKSQSEYIEKAVRFYSGYLDTKHAETYLPVSSPTCWRGSLVPSENAWATCCSSRRWTRISWRTWLPI